MSVQERISPRFQEPQRSSDIHTDIDTWIKLGDCIVLHNAGTVEHVYHQCRKNPKVDFSDERGYESISLGTIRVIYIDTQKREHLGSNQQWRECLCILKHRVMDYSQPTYKYCF
jgi:hypothetical protein